MTSETIIKDTSANPAPLGLLAFGLTTVLLNLHNVGLYPNNAMILGMGIFVGGLAQIFAGLLESKKGNTFGTTAFVAFGTFWLSLVAIWMLPELGLATKADTTAMVFYLTIWGLFTAGMFLGTLRLNHALQVVFATLAVLFWLLALGDLHGQWRDHAGRRRGRHRLRAVGDLHGHRPGPQRGLRPHRLPARADRSTARADRRRASSGRQAGAAAAFAQRPLTWSGRVGPSTYESKPMPIDSSVRRKRLLRPSCSSARAYSRCRSRHADRAERLGRDGPGLVAHEAHPEQVRVRVDEHVAHDAARPARGGHAEARVAQDVDHAAAHRLAEGDREIRGHVDGAAPAMGPAQVVELRQELAELAVEQVERGRPRVEPAAPRG